MTFLVVNADRQDWIIECISLDVALWHAKKPGRYVIEIGLCCYLPPPYLKYLNDAKEGIKKFHEQY